MTDTIVHPNRAEEASRRTLAAVFDCLDSRRSFLVEAGAGAGKTYTLIKSLQYLLRRDRSVLARRQQRIACITFTNVAKEEICNRTDHTPVIYCDTIHAFSWSLIKRFQPQLRESLKELTVWNAHLSEVENLETFDVAYELGHRKVDEHRLLLHHDDVIELTSTLLRQAKFRSLVASQFPIILVDEYQDTHKTLVAAIKDNLLTEPPSILFGFFGDHWQKIYGEGCGRIDAGNLTVIGKEANFRAARPLVDCLNRMRPELPQFAVDLSSTARIRILHTNTWRGPRQTRNHWQGDLPDAAAQKAYDAAITILESDGWDLSPHFTRILMLTHRTLASHQGYASLPTVFSYNDSFTKKEQPHIAFFADTLEPACLSYIQRRYADMFQVLKHSGPTVRGKVSKPEWIAFLDELLQRRENGTVFDVICYMKTTGILTLPPAVEKLENALAKYQPSAGAEMPRQLAEVQQLHQVPYQEIVHLSQYLAGHSPFETKHGVKGAEFENVFAVIGRGWNHYDFNRMLELAAFPNEIAINAIEMYERNRNLFYVVCSRPKTNLTLLFTQELSVQALNVLGHWFGRDNLQPIDIA